MRTAPPLDPFATSEVNRSAFRRWALRNHPDRGGDAAVFAAGLARYRAIAGGGGQPARPGPVVGRSRHTSLSLLVRWVRRRRARRVE